MNMVPLGELMPSRIPSVNPSKHLDETFELWSIPAFDHGEPERLKGSEIGSTKKCVEPNDVLLSRIVPHIRRSWVVRPVNGARQIASGEWITFRSPKIFPPYLRHVLISDEFHAQFMKTVAGVGGSLVRARPEGVKQIEISLPPLEEQKRLAAVLDQADKLHHLRHRSLDRLNSLEQAIFHEMFGDPNFNPKNWPLKSFGECVENRDSLRVPIKQSDRDMRSGDYPYYGSVGIIDDIDDYLYEGEHLLVSEDGKHLESRSRPIACLADGKFWVNNHAHVVRDMGIADLVFLKAFLDAVSIKNHISGIDQIKLNRKSMDKISVPLPPRELQEEYRRRVQILKSNIVKMELAEASMRKLSASVQNYAFRGEL